MNERAARCARSQSDMAGVLLPIWHVDRGRALFVGPLGRNALHAHSVPVLLAGVYAPFRIQIAVGGWLSCRMAVVPAGVPYEFDVDGQPLAVLYLEPSEAGAETLVPLISDGREEGGALIGDRGQLATIRELYEARDGARWAAEALDDLLTFAKPRARRTLDARITRAVSALASDAAGATRVGDAARAVGLSASRFQHLFAEEIGVPFRRFRLWQRLRVAIGEIAAGRSFTASAHEAGFADQAHFTRAFRQTFGASPSPSLRKVRRG